MTANLIPPARLRPAASDVDLKRIVWPIVRRLPSYVRLGWALLRDPAIERRHKALLTSAVLYTVTPIHLILSPIPVVGQLDSVVLLLLGLQQALAHCPPESRARYFARLQLRPRQITKDLHVVLYATWVALGKVGRPIHRLRFAGHVAAGFGRRIVRRLAGSRERAAAFRLTLR